MRITAEELRDYRIFLGTPMYGGQCSGLYTKSVADLSMICAANGIYLKHYFLFNESLVQRARNYIVDEFLRSDCTHLVFIDSDIGFDPRDVLAMVGIQGQNSDVVSVVAGPYPKKTIAWEKVHVAAKLGKGEQSPFDLEKYSADYVFNLASVKAGDTIDLSQPIQVGEAGTGFMCIPREVFEAFKERYPELSYVPDHVRTANFDGSREITAFFDCVIDPNNKRYLSEDYFFCQKLREMQKALFLCPWMKLSHVGMYIFKGDLQEMTELNLSATADDTSRRDSYRKPSKFKRSKK